MNGSSSDRAVRGTVSWLDYRRTWPTPYGRLVVGRDSCLLVSRFGVRRRIRREDVVRVEVFGFAIWFGPRDTVYFVGHDGKLIRPAFKPWATQKTLDLLTEFGWPAREETPGRAEYHDWRRRRQWQPGFFAATGPR